MTRIVSDDMGPSPKKLAIVIPCYNVREYCEAVVAKTALMNTQVVLVDDGSTDGTSEVLQEQAKKFPKLLHYIRQEPNQGKGYALLSGFRYALEKIPFDILITIDGDGQHNPLWILPLAKKVEEGADLAIGCRTFSQMPLKNRFANTLISLFLRIVYRDAPIDTQSGMRAFTKKLVEEIVLHVPGGHYESEFQTLIYALHNKKKMVSFSIPTVYIDKNVSSHFKNLRDSVKILKVLIAYIWSLK